MMRMQSLGGSTDFDDFKHYTIYDDSATDADYDDLESAHIFFSISNIMGVLDSVLFNPADSSQSLVDADGRISLAYEKLTKIPRRIAEKFSKNTTTLDLSHNNIKDLSFLINFKVINTLVLDKNDSLIDHTLPYLPSLRILWLNNCNIQNMPKWIKTLQGCCPNLKQLSLMGNPGIISTFNGGTVLEHYDYRMYVISQLPNLEYLDDTAVTEQQRLQAKTHKHAYALSGGRLRFIEKFGSTSFLSLFQRKPDSTDTSN